MTALSTIGTDLYRDLVTTLKPQVQKTSVDSSSLGLKLADKTIVQGEEKKSDFTNYYSSLQDSAIFKELQGMPSVVSSNGVVNSLLGTGTNAQEAVYINNALNVYHSTNSPRECTTVEVDV